MVPRQPVGGATCEGPLRALVEGDVPAQGASIVGRAGVDRGFGVPRKKPLDTTNKHARGEAGELRAARGAAAPFSVQRAGVHAATQQPRPTASPAAVAASARPPRPRSPAAHLWKSDSFSASCWRCSFVSGVTSKPLFDTTFSGAPAAGLGRHTPCFDCSAPMACLKRPPNMARTGADARRLRGEARVAAPVL
jgi:hypothetical protein